MHRVGRIVFLLIGAAFFAGSPSFAANKSLEKALRQLDPDTRLMQVCDIEAMKRIRSDPNAYRPDRAVLYAMADPKISENSIRGNGGAFRSKGKWYRFTFHCVATEDRMQVLSFDYQLGDAIPEDEWEKHGLWH